ncbi:MAG TPA: hypothetical protein VGR00_01345 [Thermoanaerobaculia bacterium]|nr:hypothetical protein [Thermoanaerobaculia bacterium]
MTTRSARAALVLSLTALALTAGCAKKGDPVREPIDRITAAADKRDADGVVAWIASDYHDETGNGRAEIEGLVKRAFAGYDSLAVTVTKLQIEPGFDVAHASFDAELSGTPRAIGGLDGLLPRSSVWHFDLKLVKEKDKWKVGSAGWSQVR